MLGPLLEVEMSRKWTPLCREADLEVKTYKAYQRQRPILLEVEMLKKCTPLWRKTHFEVKMCRNLQRQTTFGSWDVEKVYAVVAKSTFPSQNVKDTTCSDHFWRFRCGFAWQAQGILHLAKGFVAFPKTMAGVGHLQRICKDAFRVAGTVQETCSSEMLGGQGADFLRELQVC